MIEKLIKFFVNKHKRSRQITPMNFFSNDETNESLEFFSSR